MSKYTLKHLQELQALPLNLKVRMTQQRIREWVREYGTDGVYVSFSGGKDSTVLLDIVRDMYPDIPAVFCDVPTQYPELRDFAKTWDNVEIVKPKITFMEVCEKYGFPLISKEVSECVEGARKYLTSVIAEQNALTDRQTDRQTSRMHTDLKSCADLASLAKMSGGVRQEVQETQRNRRVPYQWEWEKINGIGYFGKPSTNAKLGGRRSKKVRETHRNIYQR